MRILSSKRHSGKTTFLRKVNRYTLHDRLVTLAIMGGTGNPLSLARKRTGYANSTFWPNGDHRFVSFDPSFTVIDGSSFVDIAQKAGFTVSSGSLDSLLASGNTDYWGKINNLQSTISNIALLNNKSFTFARLLKGADDFIVGYTDLSDGIWINVVFMSGEQMRDGINFEACPAIALEGWSRFPIDFSNWKIRNESSSASEVLDLLRHDVTEAALNTGKPHEAIIQSTSLSFRRSYNPDKGKLYVNGAEKAVLNDVDKAFIVATYGSTLQPGDQANLMTTLHYDRTKPENLLFEQYFNTAHGLSAYTQEVENASTMNWLDGCVRQTFQLDTRALILAAQGMFYCDSLRSILYGGDGPAASKGIASDVFPSFDATNYVEGVFTLALGDSNPLEGQDVEALTAGGICWTDKEGYIGDMVWGESRFRDERSVARPLFFEIGSMQYSFFDNHSKCICYNTDTKESTYIDDVKDEDLQVAIYSPEGVCDSGKVLYPTTDW